MARNTPVPTEPNSGKKKKLSKRVLIAVIGVVLLLLVAGGGFWYTKYYANRENRAEEQFQATLQEVQRQIDTGQYAEAEQKLQKYIASRPTQERRDQAQNLLGIVYVNLGDMDKAQEQFDPLLDKWPADDPQQFSILTSLVYIANQKGDKQSGKRYLEAIIRSLEARSRQETEQQGRPDVATVIDLNRYKQILASLEEQM